MRSETSRHLSHELVARSNVALRVELGSVTSGSVWQSEPRQDLRGVRPKYP